MSEHELWNELGNLYFMSGAYNQAANAYQRSIQADTEFGRPYSNLALTYVQQGKYDEAIDLYRRSIELLADNEEKAISLNRLGDVYRHLKDYSRAVIAFQQADELDPRGVDEFPPAARPRAEMQPAPSSVVDEPVVDIVYAPADQTPVESTTDAVMPEAIAETSLLAVDEPATEPVEEPVAAMPEEPVAEALVEMAVKHTEETVSLIADEPAMLEEPVAEVLVEMAVEHGEQTVTLIADEPVMAEEPVAIAEEPVTIEEPVAIALEPVAFAEEPAAPLAELPSQPAAIIEDEPAEWLTEFPEAFVAEVPDEPAEETLDEQMTRRLGFLVGEALSDAVTAISDQPVPEDQEPEIEPELEWWDVDDERMDSATHSQADTPNYIEEPSTSWTPADLSEFQQDLSQMPDSGSLTSWGDGDYDDDFERWSPLEPGLDVDAPESDEDNIATWLPIPEERPLALDELRVPPFVDELEEESEPASDWESLTGIHKIEADFTPILPSTINAAHVEPPARSEAAVSQQKAWQPEVDVAVQERPAADFTVVPQERPSRVEIEPAPRTAQPELAMAPVMAEVVPAAQPAEPERDEAEMREIELGIEKFRRVVQLNPGNGRAWDSLGSLYKSAGMYKDAILAYQQAISHDSTKSLYYHHLGLVYACEGRDEDAITAFQRVIEIDPEYSLAHATLGGYYRKMGLEELAQKHIGKAMKNIFDSENEYNRACLEAICGNADQAIKLLDVALKNKQTYVDWILRDPDLDFIRQDPRFKQLISRYTR